MFIVHVHCSLFMFIVHCSHGATLIFDDVFYMIKPDLDLGDDKSYPTVVAVTKGLLYQTPCC